MIVDQMKFKNKKKIKLKRIEDYNDNNENNKYFFFIMELMYYISRYVLVYKGKVFSENSSLTNIQI